MLNQSLNTLGRLAKGSKAYAASACSSVYATVASTYAIVANTAPAATTVASAVPAAIALGNQLKELVGIINDNNIDNQDRKARVEEVLQNVETIL